MERQKWQKEYEFGILHFHRAFEIAYMLSGNTVFTVEDEKFPAYMNSIWEAMKSSVKRGITDEGILPGGLDVQKKALGLTGFIAAPMTAGLVIFSKEILSLLFKNSE